MTLSLILDLVVAGLLVVTIAYAVLLNRRIGTLRRDKSELQALALNFAESTARAEDSIGRLKKTADELKGRVSEARSLRDDLAFLTDRGGSTADRLEEVVRAARKEAPTTPANVSKKPARVPESADERDDPPTVESDAEQELIRALQSARQK